MTSTTYKELQASCLDCEDGLTTVKENGVYSWYCETCKHYRHSWKLLFQYTSSVITINQTFFSREPK